MEFAFRAPSSKSNDRANAEWLHMREKETLYARTTSMDNHFSLCAIACFDHCRAKGMPFAISQKHVERNELGHFPSFRDVVRL